MSNEIFRPQLKNELEKKGYKIKSLLSEVGAFSTVFRATKTQKEKVSSGASEDVAVKVVELKEVDNLFRENYLPRELALSIRLKHPNIVKVYDIFKTENKILIFMELAFNGSVRDYLKKNGQLSEKHACKWFKQMTEAVRYLHKDMNVAHRDIKLDNFLLDGNYVIKMGDFGFSREVIDPNTKKPILSGTFLGTEPYYCPQLLCRIKYDAKAADIWALGIVLFVMLNNKFLYHFKDRRTMFNEQYDQNEYIKTRYTKPKEFSKEYQQLQEKMLKFKESDRWTIEQCIC